MPCEAGLRTWACCFLAVLLGRRAMSRDAAEPRARSPDVTQRGAPSSNYVVATRVARRRLARLRTRGPPPPRNPRTGRRPGPSRSGVVWSLRAAAEDLNGDGSVGWWEFCQIWFENRPSVKLSPMERIYLTFEDPGKSKVGKLVSTMVMLAIFVSALGLAVQPARREERGRERDSKETEQRYAHVTICLRVRLPDAASAIAEASVLPRPRLACVAELGHLFLAGRLLRLISRVLRTLLLGKRRKVPCASLRWEAS